MLVGKRSQPSNNLKAEFNGKATTVLRVLHICCILLPQSVCLTHLLHSGMFFQTVVLYLRKEEGLQRWFRVKSACCSYRKPQLFPAPTLAGYKSPLTLVPRIQHPLTLFWTPWAPGTHTVYIHPCKQTYKMKTKWVLKKKKSVEAVRPGSQRREATKDSYFKKKKRKERAIFSSYFHRTNEVCWKQKVLLSEDFTSFYFI